MQLISSNRLKNFSRLIKLFISLVFFALASAYDCVRQIFGRPAPGYCVVLYYHRVVTEQRALFARQMDELLRWTKPVTADLSGPLLRGQRYAAVTFDDGFQNVLENALPEMEKRRIPAALFIVTEALGQTPQWESFSSDDLPQDRIVTADQLRALSADHVIIGSHTMNHPWLPSLTESEVRRELTGSRAKLERILGRHVTLFSFPYGAFHHELVAWCREAGYQRTFTILPTVAFAVPGEFVTGRISVEPTDWVLEFRLKVLGAYRWLPIAFDLKRSIFSSLFFKKVLNQRSRPNNNNNLNVIPGE